MDPPRYPSVHLECDETVVGSMEQGQIMMYRLNISGTIYVRHKFRDNDLCWNQNEE